VAIAVPRENHKKHASIFGVVKPGGNGLGVGKVLIDLPTFGDIVTWVFSSYVLGFAIAVPIRIFQRFMEHV
jgi:hypothetical protein